jgi:hypothetical protein
MSCRSPFAWRVATDYRASLSPLLAWIGLIVRSRGPDLLPVLQKRPCTTPQRWARQVDPMGMDGE